MLHSLHLLTDLGDGFDKVRGATGPLKRSLSPCWITYSNPVLKTLKIFINGAIFVVKFMKKSSL